jgi:hypothetical protein
MIMSNDENTLRSVGAAVTGHYNGGESRQRPSCALSWGPRRSDNLTIIRSPRQCPPGHMSAHSEIVVE